MSFHEVTFPRYIARGASGVPRRADEIAELASGFEERNTPWADSRRRYDGGIGLRSLDDLHEVIGFFEGRRGRLYGFRYWDPADFKSCPPLQAATALDQALGTGDAAALDFQLVKTYEPAGPLPWARIIKKPVSGSVLVAVDGVAQTEGVDFTLDAATGLISFAVAPGVGLAVTAGYHFDVPVRFDADAIEVSVRNFQNGEIPAIPMVEIRIP